MIKNLEIEASRRILPRLFAEVSITARPFFEHMAYQVVEQQQVEIRGQTLTNFRMEKLLK